MFIFYLTNFLLNFIADISWYDYCNVLTLFFSRVLVLTVLGEFFGLGLIKIILKYFLRELNNNFPFFTVEHCSVGISK